MSVSVFWTLTNTQRPHSGGDICSCERARYLRRMGVSINSKIKPRLLKNFPYPLKVIFLNFWFFFQIFFFRGKTIVESSGDRDYFFILNLAARLSGKRVIIIVNEALTQKESKFKAWKRSLLYRFFFTTGNMLIVDSLFIKKWIEDLGFKCKRIVLIPPVMTVSPSFDACKKRNLNKTIKLICVANIRENKGQNVLVEALKDLPERNFHLYFLGAVKDEKYYCNLVNQIKSAGLEDYITFTGFLEQENLSCYYKEADIFVLPTLRETYGMAVAEAMAFGLPVITSDVDSLPELITKGVEGILVPPKDPRILADSLKMLIENPILRHSLGKNAMKKAARFPSRRKVNKQFYELVMESAS